MSFNDAWIARPVLRSDNSGRSTPDTWGIAVEVPVQLIINGQPWLVMLASPDNLENLALGLLITEGIVTDPHVVSDIRVAEYLQEFTVSIEAASISTDRDLLRRRNIVSNSSCGLCGLESLAALHNSYSSERHVRFTLDDSAIRLAVSSLASLQPLGLRTRSVHAAAWCSTEGKVELVREDVGRHNALDKLAGALVMPSGDSKGYSKAGFVLMSSRCSYELVAKSAAIGAQALVSISAPTSMALRWGQQLGIPVISVLGRGNEMEIVRFPSTELDVNLLIDEVSSDARQ